MVTDIHHHPSFGCRAKVTQLLQRRVNPSKWDPTERCRGYHLYILTPFNWHTELLTRFDSSILQLTNSQLLVFAGVCIGTSGTVCTSYAEFWGYLGALFGATMLPY